MTSGVRAAVAGAAAATVWGLLEPLDQRLLRCDYSDIALLGKAGLDIPAAGLIGIPLLVFAVCAAVLRRRSHPPRPVEVPS